MQDGFRASVAVQLTADSLRFGMHTVVYLYFAAAEHYTVVCALRTVAVVVIILMCRNAESVFALREDRLTEQIFVFALCVFVHHVLCVRHAVEVREIGLFYTEEAQLHTVLQLAERYADRTMVDMAEGIVAEHLYTIVA